MTDIEAVVSRLDELESVLRSHEVAAWPEKIRRVRVESRNERHVLQRSVLDLYKGTMGSLRDLYVCRQNGDRVDDEIGANARLDRLRDELWELARAL